MLKTVLPPCIWISGGAIETADGFWQAVVDGLGIYTTEAAETSSSEGITDLDGISGGVGIPKVAHVEGKAEATVAKGSGRKHTLGRERSARAAAVAELRKDLDTIIVIVFDGLRVIVASVPHRAFDVVRVEKEMTGRVEQLQIAFWSQHELQGIANKGIAALNVRTTDAATARLPGESFGSPHLMQEFCLHLCKSKAFARRPSNRPSSTLPRIGTSSSLRVRARRRSRRSTC